MENFEIPSVELKLDLQAYYDNLVAYRDALNAQLAALEAGGRVCNHPVSAIRMDTLVNNGIHGMDWAVCDGCRHWVPVKG